LTLFCFHIGNNCYQQIAHLRRESASPTIVGGTPAAASEACSNCEPGCDCATSGLERVSHVNFVNKSAAGKATSYRANCTVNGFTYVLYRGKCLKKANAAAAKMEACKSGKEYAGVLLAAVSFSVRKTKK